VLVNLALWLFPGLGHWLHESVGRLAEPAQSRPEPNSGPVRVMFPWKAMLVGSLILTVVVNVLARLLG
jgi:hypothetical protein